MAWCYIVCVYRNLFRLQWYCSCPWQEVLTEVSPHLSNVRLHVSILSPYLFKRQASPISIIFTYHVSHPLRIRSPLVSNAQNMQIHQSDGCMKTCNFSNVSPTFHLVYVRKPPVQWSAMAAALRDVIRLAPFADSEPSSSSCPAGLPIGYYYYYCTYYWSGCSYWEHVEVLPAKGASLITSLKRFIRSHSTSLYWGLQTHRLSETLPAIKVTSLHAAIRLVEPCVLGVVY